MPLGASVTGWTAQRTLSKRRSRSPDRHAGDYPAARAVARANERLDRDGCERLPERLTPHSLRHVIGQLGHTDPGLTLRNDPHQMRRRDGERE
jgi:hypothetical protein